MALAVVPSAPVPNAPGCRVNDDQIGTGGRHLISTWLSRQRRLTFHQELARGARAPLSRGVRLALLLNVLFPENWPDAVAAIENDGGTILYDWEWDNGHSVPAGRPRAPRWLVTRIGVDFFGHVTVAKSRSPSLAQVGRLTGLQTLHVNSLRVLDYELEVLKGLTNRSELDLRGTRVRDAGQMHLTGLTRLSSLDLTGTHVTDAGVKELQQALPSLKIIR